MKKAIIIGAALTICLYAAAQNGISCVTACPAEDASTSMNLSWAADTTITDSYVLIAELSDTGWRRTRKVKPAQNSVCDEFYGLPSASPAGEKITEYAKFIKCGATVRGLKADTEYKFVVCTAKNRKKAIKEGTVHKFKTAGSSEWSACVISDFHNYTPLPKRLESAMNMIGTIRNYDPGFDWVLHLGDICAWGGSHSFWESLYSQKNLQDYMWAGVNGNHDNMSRSYQKNSNAFFRDSDYYPRNGYGEQQGVCYWFRYGNALFLMLNNEAMHDYMGLHDAQDWVRKVITEQKSSDNPPLYTIVCEHYQWFYGEEGKDSHYSRWHELFDELGVDLAMAGNNHIYVRSLPIFDGKVTDGTYGTTYVQTASCDNERGMDMSDIKYNSDRLAFRWTEGGKTVSAMDMKVTDDKMTLALLDRNGKVLDKFEVLAKKDKKTKEDVLGNYLRDSLQALTARCAQTLKAAYMAENKLETRYDVPGWEGFPVEKWEYHTGVDININAPKRGLVYMLNPSPEKLAKWILNSVYDATGDVRYEDLEKTRKFITWQSGAQFPVAGVVYEAMYKEGDWYPYIFKDGVTVYMKNEELHKSKDNNPGDDLLNFYLNMTYDDLKENTGRYARISSTTREMYYKAGGKAKVGQSDDGQRSQAWLSTVKELYQQAWNSDRNFLIYSWCYSNLEH